MPEERTYRTFGRDGAGLVAFRAAIETTDLYVKAGKDLEKETLAAIKEARTALSDHGRARPEFFSSLKPLSEPPGDIHPVPLAMYRAARAAGVGPMAAVAGAVAEWVAKTLKNFSTRVIVENGGDIWIDDDKSVLVGIYAGKSPFSGRIALEFGPDRLPLAVCTSSATVGPSLSFGLADAATVAAADGALADAVATGLGNRIGAPADIEPALDWAMGVPGVLGALAIMGDNLGLKGELTLSKS